MQGMLSDSLGSALFGNPIFITGTQFFSLSDSMSDSIAQFSLSNLPGGSYTISTILWGVGRASQFCQSLPPGYTCNGMLISYEQQWKVEILKNQRVNVGMLKTRTRVKQ
jgi:hypothetical protein